MSVPVFTSTIWLPLRACRCPQYSLLCPSKSLEVKQDSAHGFQSGPFFISYIVFCDFVLQWIASQKNHFDLIILISDTTAEVDSAFDFDFLLSLTQMQVIALSEMNDGVVVNINGGWNMIKKKQVIIWTSNDQHDHHIYHCQGKSKGGLLDNHRWVLESAMMRTSAGSFGTIQRWLS